MDFDRSFGFIFFSLINRNTIIFEPEIQDKEDKTYNPEKNLVHNSPLGATVFENHVSKTLLCIYILHLTRLYRNKMETERGVLVTYLLTILISLKFSPMFGNQNSKT